MTVSPQNCQKTSTTLPETNIAPENRVSQKETSIPTIHFQGQTVSFREGIGYTSSKLTYSNVYIPPFVDVFPIGKGGFPLLC